MVMGAKYRIFEFRFNSALWRTKIRALSDEMVWMVAAATKIAPATIRHWRTLKDNVEFPFPSMSNFIDTCNALDIDPRDFFVLDDGGRDE